MKYCFDLDETICATPASRKYAEAVPYIKVVSAINDLYDQGNEITIFTARGGSSGIDYTELTHNQLQSWGLKYHKLILKKPSYDYFIDDKAINSVDWRNKNNIKIVGFVASCFDLLHAGHCLYLKEAKSYCDHLVAGLHVDPSNERANKNKPIQSLEERKIQLESTKYVDEILIYNTEQELENLIKQVKPDVRFLGSDCQDKKITGYEYCKNIIYHNRANHIWSSSELRTRIKNDIR
jgi:glycerol-3-phosphate cytidylyltransferase